MMRCSSDEGCHFFTCAQDEVRICLLRAESFSAAPQTFEGAVSSQDTTRRDSIKRANRRRASLLLRFSRTVTLLITIPSS